jgi:RNA polymerase sigma factor (sigma-70 family)
MAATETSARANKALDELYRQHVGDVYRYTYAVLGNHADAEDVTQTTFVNALRALERGELPRDASHWLLAIAHNVVRQRWRQAAARPTLVELASDVPDGPQEQEAYELDELVRALQRIPESQREALVMRELEGRSYREIAELLGLTTSALETLLFRARRSLADELENVVTCQNAEVAISKRLDGRLSRKERKRLNDHLAECSECSRLAATEARQRRAFKGLALLPLPIGLALFKGAPSAAAATSLPTIGLAGSGSATTGTGAGTATAAGTAAATGTGATTVGGSLAGGILVKVTVVAVTATVAVSAGYKGIQVVRDEGSDPAPVRVEAKLRPGTGTPAGRVLAAGRAGGARAKPAQASEPGEQKQESSTPAKGLDEAGIPSGVASTAGAEDRASAPAPVDETSTTGRSHPSTADKGTTAAPPAPAKPTHKAAPKPSGAKQKTQPKGPTGTQPGASGPAQSESEGAAGGDGTTPTEAPPPAAAPAQSAPTAPASSPPPAATPPAAPSAPASGAGAPPSATPPSGVPPATPPATPDPVSPPVDPPSSSTPPTPPAPPAADPAPPTPPATDPTPPTPPAPAVPPPTEPPAQTGDTPPGSDGGAADGDKDHHHHGWWWLWQWLITRGGSRPGG